MALETEDFSRTGGCTRQAIEANFTPEQMNTSYLSPKDARIAEDPRMVAASERGEGGDEEPVDEIWPDAGAVAESEAGS